MSESGNGEKDIQWKSRTLDYPTRQEGDESEPAPPAKPPFILTEKRPYRPDPPPPSCECLLLVRIQPGRYQCPTCQKTRTFGGWRGPM